MYINYFLILSFWGCINLQTAQYDEDKELLQKIVESNPSISFSIKDIPKKLRMKYKEKYNVTLTLSNPGAYYNKTDVVYGREPNGMLLFLGKTDNNIGFVLFEIKGITSQCCFLYYKAKGKKIIKIESLILKKQPQDFEQLSQIIIKREFL